VAGVGVYLAFSGFFRWGWRAVLACGDVAWLHGWGWCGAVGWLVGRFCFPVVPAFFGFLWEGWADGVWGGVRVGGCRRWRVGKYRIVGGGHLWGRPSGVGGAPGVVLFWLCGLGQGGWRREPGMVLGRGLWRWLGLLQSVWGCGRAVGSGRVVLVCELSGTLVGWLACPGVVRVGLCDHCGGAAGVGAVAVWRPVGAPGRRQVSASTRSLADFSVVRTELVR